MKRVMSWLLVAGLSLSALSPAIAAAKPTTIVLTMKEFGFSPARVSVKVNRVVRIQLTNKGTMSHEFVSPALFKNSRGVKVTGARLKEGSEVEIERGKRATIEIVPTKVGTYAFWCGEKFKGKLHRDLGMKGTLRVSR